MGNTNNRIHAAGGGLAATVVLLLAAAPGWSQQYTVTDLGTLGGPVSDAFAVNNLGNVAGVSAVLSANYHGYFGDAALQEILPLTAQQSHAFDVNAGNQVVAASYDLGEIGAHGQIWQTNLVTNLGNITPHGINDTGSVVGYLSTQDPTFGWLDHAALWQTGTIYDLGTLGGHFSYACAITNDLRIVGTSFTASDAGRRATLWLGGIPTDLGTLGGTNSEARDINAAWQVVGSADTAVGEPHAFLFALDANGNVLSRTDLGTLGGGYSYAYGVNSSGAVVGTSNAAAFRWQSGTLVDLNTLVPAAQNWHLDAARAINDRGQIVGAGQHNGQPRAFLLSPSLRGDMNCDGLVSYADINPFVLALTSQAAYNAQYPNCNWMNADINADGVVSYADINPFVALLGK
jgi:probable HAF family extracellular repeat protein